MALEVELSASNIRSLSHVHTQLALPRLSTTQLPIIVLVVQHLSYTPPPSFISK